MLRAGPEERHRPRDEPGAARNPDERRAQHVDTRECLVRDCHGPAPDKCGGDRRWTDGTLRRFPHAGFPPSTRARSMATVTADREESHASPALPDVRHVCHRLWLLREIVPQWGRRPILLSRHGKNGTAMR